MRHMLALFALCALLVACDDSSTSPNGTASAIRIRWTLCSDSAHINNEVRRYSLSDNSSISIPKSSRCTSFVRDTSTSVIAYYGDKVWMDTLYTVGKNGEKTILIWNSGDQNQSYTNGNVTLYSTYIGGVKLFPAILISLGASLDSVADIQN